MRGKSDVPLIGLRAPPTYKSLEKWRFHSGGIFVHHSGSLLEESNPVFILYQRRMT
jgi:hypothetical protein